MGNKKATSNKSVRKEARQKVYNKLVVALAEFKTGIKDKKFEKNLRKTSKLFTADIIKVSKDKNRTPKLAKKQIVKGTDDQMQKSA